MASLADAIGQRFGDSGPAGGSIGNALIRRVRRRKSVRHYSDATPDVLVDHMKLCVDAGACDAINIMPARFDDEMDQLVDQVVPTL